MRILITGATGFVGSYLSRILCQRHDVVGTGHLNEQPSAVPIIHWQDAGQADVLIHLAANNDTQSRDYDAMMRANYYWPIEMFDYYYGKGCRKFIWASSGAVHDCLTPYAQSKKNFEGWTLSWTRDKDVSCIGFRFTNVWSLIGEEHKGKRASMVHQINNMIKNGQPPILFKGNPKRDFIHIDDVCECIKSAISVQTSGVFNLGSGVSVPFENIINYCNRLYNSNIIPDYIDCPFKDTYQFHTCADIARTKDIFNWSPTIFIA
jgi:nucleoside-diphosphate-sugar epimerase